MEEAVPSACARPQTTEPWNKNAAGRFLRSGIKRTRINEIILVNSDQISAE